MVARLLLAVAGTDAESRLGDDLLRARRLAVLFGEGADVSAALSRTLIETLPGEQTIPHVEVELSEWGQMRAQLLILAVGVAGSVAAASPMLRIPGRQLRRELRRARRRMRRIL